MMTVILESALRTSVMAAFVWAALRLFRISNVVAQKIAWCLVLVAAFAMPCLVRCKPSSFLPPYCCALIG
jgi:hypothetical protein